MTRDPRDAVVEAARAFVDAANAYSHDEAAAFEALCNALATLDASPTPPAEAGTGEREALQEVVRRVMAWQRAHGDDPEACGVLSLAMKMVREVVAPVLGPTWGTPPAPAAPPPAPTATPAAETPTGERCWHPDCDGDHAAAHHRGAKPR